MMLRFLIVALVTGAAQIGTGAERTRCNGFDDAAAAWTAVASGAQEPIPLRPLDPSVLLPDGSPFRTWEQPAEHRRTFFVAQGQPNA